MTCDKGHGLLFGLKHPALWVKLATFEFLPGQRLSILHYVSAIADTSQWQCRMGDYNPSENSYDPIMGKSAVENGDLLTAGVKYVPRGEKGGRLLPIFSSSVTSSRTALLLSLLSLLTALVLLALGLASLAPLPSKVAEQHKVSSNSPIKIC